MAPDAKARRRSVLATESVEEQQLSNNGVSPRETSCESTATRRPAIRPQNDWINELYQRHAGNLLGYIRKLVGRGPPDPQDVVHASFEKLASLEFPDRVENPHAFLWRIAQNILSSEARSAAVRSRHAINVIDVFYSDSGDGVDPERVLLAHTELSAIVAALESMPEKRRTVFLMSRVDGLSLVEISQRLGISRPAVSKRLLLALQDLRKAVDRR